MVGWRLPGVGRVIITGCRDVDIVVVRAPAGEMVWVAVAYNVERAGDGGMQSSVLEGSALKVSVCRPISSESPCSVSISVGDGGVETEVVVDLKMSCP